MSLFLNFSLNVQVYLRCVCINVYKQNRDTIFKFGLRSKGKLMSMNVPRETSWVGSAWRGVISVGANLSTPPRQITFSRPLRNGFLPHVWHSMLIASNENVLLSLLSPYLVFIQKRRAHTQPATGAFCIRNGSNCLFLSHSKSVHRLSSAD